VPQGVNRDRLIADLREVGIETTIGTYCMSATTYYRNRYDNVQPHSEDLQRTTITLPCYEGVDLDYVCSAMLDKLDV